MKERQQQQEKSDSKGARHEARDTEDGDENLREKMDKKEQKRPELSRLNTSLLVSSAVSHPQQRVAQEGRLARSFAFFDDGSDGVLDRSEFYRFLRSLYR